MRLTTHDKGRQPYVITANERTWREIYDKLAAYEDTGVEPEEIEDRQDVCLWIPEDRFAEIINAEAQGRLVILPCKVGDTVYRITRHLVDVSGYRMEWELETIIEAVKFRIEMTNAIGKTVFLSREAAEAVLQGDQSDV